MLKVMYYKKLIYVIMEVGEFQDLWSAGQRPRKNLRFCLKHCIQCSNYRLFGKHQFKMRKKNISLKAFCNLG